MDGAARCAFPDFPLAALRHEEQADVAISCRIRANGMAVIVIQPELTNALTAFRAISAWVVDGCLMHPEVRALLRPGE